MLLYHLCRRKVLLNICIIGTIFEANVFPPLKKPVKTVAFSWFKLLINLIVNIGVSWVQESALFFLLLTPIDGESFLLPEPAGSLRNKLVSTEILLIISFNLHQTM